MDREKQLLVLNRKVIAKLNRIEMDDLNGGNTWGAFGAKREATVPTYCKQAGCPQEDQSDAGFMCDSVWTMPY
ncbi:MAG: hypothetical protein JW774_04600 [Candidatus Aureabacteria bacterium]|nr:hypothetical protein [Candidatus Auribacterota bacterium]